MKVSFHPAQVGTPKKERSSRFQIANSITLQKDLLLTQVSSEDQAKTSFIPSSLLFLFRFYEFLNSIMT